MACIHGLENNNCPICRISRSTFPINSINKIDLKKNELSPFKNLFRNKLSTDMTFKDDISNISRNYRPNLIYDFPKPNLINSIPNFENKLFLERIDNISIEKPNDLRRSRKISLENPELKLDEEE